MYKCGVDQNEPKIEPDKVKGFFFGQDEEIFFQFSFQKINVFEIFDILFQLVRSMRVF